MGRGRGGRPPAAQAGDVDRRILDAATTLFLQQGFEATTCEQVAARAGAGKASIYARFANKEALFAAVVHDQADMAPAPSAAVAETQPVRERLREVGRSILEHASKPDEVALLRVVLGTAHRLPDLAQFAYRISRESGERRVIAALAGGQAGPDSRARATPLAARFIDLAFTPHQLRALAGDDPADLARAAPARVDDAVELLSRAGLLDDWS